MPAHIHETETGVSLRIEYDLDAEGVVFQDVRVLDAGYRPVGPNLCEFLDSLAVLSSHVPGVVDAEKFLSTIVSEIKLESK